MAYVGPHTLRVTIRKLATEAGYGVLVEAPRDGRAGWVRTAGGELATYRTLAMASLTARIVARDGFNFRCD